MPSKNTFDIPPIRALVKRYLSESHISVDPFARNKRWATYTNDINPDTRAEYHLDARDFLDHLLDRNIIADLVILDPPYSPRQISECYQEIGRKVTMVDTQNAVLYSEVKKRVATILSPSGVVISCGWNSTGMQSFRDFRIEELLLVNHGAGRNDTICMVERRIPSKQMSLLMFGEESNAVTAQAI